jgi:apolipoprotein N-acyltransferase
MNATWAALAVYCSLYFPAAVALLRRLDRTTALPLTVTLPAVWVGLEYLRSFLITGFAWYYLGHTQHAFLPVIQVSDLGGVYAVSVLVAAVNGLLFEALAGRAWFRRLAALPEGASRFGPRQAVAVPLLLAAALGYGSWRLGQGGGEPGPVVALLQNNLDQRIRNARNDPADDSRKAVQTMFDHSQELHWRSLRGPTRPDLIVWPETSYPVDWIEIDPAAPPESLPDGMARWQAGYWLMARNLSEWSGTPVLLGLSGRQVHADGTRTRTNSALLIPADGELFDRYDKRHCVPFGEYVPLRDVFPWLAQFAPYDYDYSVTPGGRSTRFPLATADRLYHFGVLICYEDTDPVLAREYAHPAREDGRDRPAADFLVNISNDGWFDGTSEHEEHLAISRFRAVECRRALVRSVNMGISAVIDGNGRVVALPGATWAESKKVAAVVTAAVPIDRRVSPYAHLGDWLPVGCWLLVGVGLVAGLRRNGGANG